MSQHILRQGWLQVLVNSPIRLIVTYQLILGFIIAEFFIREGILRVVKQLVTFVI